MRDRSGVVDHNARLEKMTAAGLNQEIARTASRLEIAETTALRRAFFKRLVWLDAHPEPAYGAAAPKRAMRARES